MASVYFGQAHVFRKCVRAFIETVLDILEISQISLEIWRLKLYRNL